MGTLNGKVAFITGAARGQGRSHAVHLAREGADIVAIDLCENIPSIEVLYTLATEEDLAETVRLVEEVDGRIVARKADVRDYPSVQSCVDEGLREFGHIDICLANAGVVSINPTCEVPEQTWQDVIDINLTGVWNTVRAVIPGMVQRQKGGSIVLTSSAAGMRGYSHMAPYSASKFGVVGLMQTLANELAEHSIRVNTIHPTNVDTQMLQNEGTYRLFMPELENPGRGDLEEMMSKFIPMPISWVDAADISAAVLWLVSDAARFVTGVQLPIDGGQLVK